MPTPTWGDAVRRPPRPHRIGRTGRWRRALALVVAGLLLLWGLRSVAVALRDGPPSPDAVVEAWSPPPLVSRTANPIVRTREVTFAAIPDELDLMLVMDVSGSYGDDIANLVDLGAGLAETVTKRSDARFGLVSFSDDPCCGGDGSDHAYRLVSALDADPDVWTEGIESLEVLSGGDEPESSLIALDRAATDPEVGFRRDATQVLVVATDADSHDPSGSGYPGRSEREVIDTLRASGIVVVGAIPAASPTPVLDRVIAATGGTRVDAASDGSDLGEAILEGLREVRREVEPRRVDCPAFDATFSPERLTAVPGTRAQVTVTLRPTSTTRPGLHHCVVDLAGRREELTVLLRP